mmetsp:Transcript_15021/g.46734  ORF Transcript_15021/g.46734 Transcript_15021/m.46734 type:complete len:273 (+) Transcript_15021:882-1700(+)
MVTAVSAMLVLRMTFCLPGGGRLNALRCSSGATIECSRMTAVSAANAPPASSSALRTRVISSQPCRNTSTALASPGRSIPLSRACSRSARIRFTISSASTSSALVASWYCESVMASSAEPSFCATMAAACCCNAAASPVWPKCDAQSAAAKPLLAVRLASAPAASRAAASAARPLPHSTISADAPVCGCWCDIAPAAACSHAKSCSSDEAASSSPSVRVKTPSISASSCIASSGASRFAAGSKTCCPAAPPPLFREPCRSELHPVSLSASSR